MIRRGIGGINWSLLMRRGKEVAFLAMRLRGFPREDQERRVREQTEREEAARRAEADRKRLEEERRQKAAEDAERREQERQEDERRKAEAEAKAQAQAQAIILQYHSLCVSLQRRVRITGFS